MKRAAIAPPVFVLSLVFASLAARPAAADWPSFGRALVTAPGGQLGPRLAPDGAGGAIAAWLDRRSPGVHLFAGHVLATGEADPAWPVDGRALFPGALGDAIAPQGQEFPAIVEDGAGGAIVTWPDARNASDGLDVFAQHVLASGAVDGAWPADGVPVCADSGQQQNPVVVADGAGGAIVAWTDARAGAFQLDIYAQHVLASGRVDPAWPANGVALCTAPDRQAFPAIVGDGAGGAIVTWYDFRNAATGSDIYAQRVLGTGVVDPAWPANGRALCTAAGAQADPRIVADGAHGAIVTWTDERDGSNHVYAQRVLASGAIAPGWPADGLPVGVTGVDEVGAAPVADGAGGAIVVWGDASGGHHDLRARHVLGPGALDPAWPAAGVALSNLPQEETGPAIVPDGAGGAIVAWQVNFDILAQHVLASGALDAAFPADGRPVCNLPSLQQNASMVATAAGGAIAAWMDERSGTDFDVYALQVLDAGTTGVGGPGAPGGIALAPPSPNPSSGPVTLRFTLPREAAASLAIYDVAGRKVRELAFGVQAAGEHALAWDLRDARGRRATPGLYFARLSAEGRTLTRKLLDLE